MRCTSRSTVSVTTCGGQWTSTAPSWTSSSSPGVTRRRPRNLPPAAYGTALPATGGHHRQERRCGAVGGRGESSSPSGPRSAEGPSAASVASLVSSGIQAGGCHRV
jgi:hypothetical protein